MGEADPIQRLNAALERRYRIERELGAGGMATVYLAADLKHERKVALKVLKPELAAVVGADRFLAEIKTTANLQHPHILPLFDSGEAEGLLFYVMPYVEGESLRDRLDREHQLPIDDAVRIATNLAEALDYAHRQGVIHRDIKPANILLQDGKPVISDFGIALAVSKGGGDRMTETGLSLGTPHYMSPEQATGDLNVGPATDTYALGCVLYEMLVGDPPFTGSTPQAVLGKIITGQTPSARKERSSVPPNVDAVIAKALEKVPADRFTTVEGFAGGLGASGFRHGQRGERRHLARGRTPIPERLLWMIAVIALALAATWGVLGSGPSPAVVRHPVSVPLAHVVGTNQRFALSPRGDRLAYIAETANGTHAIWHRNVDVLQPSMLSGTEAPTSLSFSPDGSRIAFSDEYNGLHIASIGGDSPVKIADMPEGGGSAFVEWGSDGRIYATGSGGIMALPVSGTGSWQLVTRLRGGEGRHLYPHVLPNGRGLLFTIRQPGEDVGSAIGVASFAAADHSTLVPGIRAVSSPGGHVVYARSDGALVALPFDEDRLEATGEGRVLGSGVHIGPFGLVAELSIADTGTLLYVGETPESDDAQLTWVNRDGTEAVVDSTWVAGFRTVALAPGDHRVAVSIADRGEQHIWVRSIEGEAPQRVSSGGSLNWRPAWRRDGRSLAYISDRVGPLRAFFRPSDLSDGDRELLPSEDGVEEVEWRPGGFDVLVRKGGGISGGARDIFTGRVGESGLQPVVATESNERTPSLSPDGRWMVYMSDGSIMVRTLPAADISWSITSGGGREPLWSPAGDEIFYRDDQGQMVAVRVETDPTFSVVDRRVLFDTNPYRFENNHRAYDVTGDGQRFLMIRAEEQAGQLIWVQNFAEDVKRQFLD